MRAKVHDDGSVEVVLSERNLIGLLTKLHTEGSACTLETNNVEGARMLSVRSEHDDAHYGSRIPGPMHPISETTSRLVKQAMEPSVAQFVPDEHTIAKLAVEVADWVTYSFESEDDVASQRIHNSARKLIEDTLRRGVPR